MTLGQAVTVKGSNTEVRAPVEEPENRTRGRLLLIGGLVLATAAVGAYWRVAYWGREATDDAQIDADVTSVPARTSGVVVAVHFVENQTVKTGDLLVELDPVPAQTRLAQADADLRAAEAHAAAADADARVTEVTATSNRRAAQAQVSGANSSESSTREQIRQAEAAVASAQANLDRANADSARGQRLLTSGAISKEELEHDQSSASVAQATFAEAKARLEAIRASVGEAQSQVQVAVAKLAQASEVDVLVAQARARADAAHAEAETRRAARDAAALELSYTKIFAPVDGAVSKKSVTIGQLAALGQPVVQLVPTEGRWITANFKETQLTEMRAGQATEIEIDVYPGQHIKGEIESLSNATGARFALLPPDNATGNYTKVVQRVPVRVHIREVPKGVELRPGLSAVVTVDTRK